MLSIVDIISSIYDVSIAIVFVMKVSQNNIYSSLNSDINSR